jgi:WD40 repeat protein
VGAVIQLSSFGTYLLGNYLTFGGRGFAFYPDAEIIAASQIGAVQLWDLQTGSKRYTLETGFLRLTNALAFSPNWKFLVVGYKSFRIAI